MKRPTRVPYHQNVYNLLDLDFKPSARAETGAGEDVPHVRAGLRVQAERGVTREQPMRRFSRVSRFQPIYDLLRAVPSVSTDRLARIESWESETGRTLPAAVKEFYTTDFRIRLRDRTPWVLSFDELWNEYSNDEDSRTLDQFLQSVRQPLDGTRSGFARRAPVPDELQPLVHIQTENQGNWVMCLRLDGSPDPRVYVDDPELYFLTRRPEPGQRWGQVGRAFSRMLFEWIVYYYITTDWCPLTLRGSLDPRKARNIPHQCYRHNLWLAAVDEPLNPPLLDYLTESMPEVRPPRDRNGVRTYRFRSPAGSR